MAGWLRETLALGRAALSPSKPREAPRKPCGCGEAREAVTVPPEAPEAPREREGEEEPPGFVP